MLRKLWLKEQLKNQHRKKAKYATISSKLRKIVQERDPENLVETLEKCAQITKFGSAKVSRNEEIKD